MNILAPSFLAGLLVAAPTADSFLTADNDSLLTPIGQLETTGDGISSTLTLNGKAFSTLDGKASLSNLIHGKTKSYVLVFLNSGGIACYGQFVVVEIATTPWVSDEFGNCNDTFNVKTREDDLVITMPRYSRHPDELSAQELQEVEDTEDVYELHDRKISEKAPD